MYIYIYISTYHVQNGLPVYLLGLSCESVCVCPPLGKCQRLCLAWKLQVVQLSLQPPPCAGAASTDLVGSSKVGFTVKRISSHQFSSVLNSPTQQWTVFFNDSQGGLSQRFQMLRLWKKQNHQTNREHAVENRWVWDQNIFEYYLIHHIWIIY